MATWIVLAADGLVSGFVLVADGLWTGTDPLAEGNTRDDLVATELL